VLIRQGDIIGIYVRNDDFCKGINHPEGRKIDSEFVREYFWEVIEKYRKFSQ